MKRHKKLVAATAVGVIGCAVAYLLWDRFWSPKAAGIAALRAYLYDPESLRLKGAKYFSATGATCGEANARNRMGGYTGFRRFVVDHDGEVFIEPESRASSDDPKAQLAEVELKIAFLKLMDARCLEAKTVAR